MKLSTIILGLTTFTQAALAYELQTDYSGEGFFDKFTFFSGADLTHGFVQYQNSSAAKSQKLAYVHDNHIFLRSDNKSVTPNGHPSVRLHSNTLHNYGLFIFDLNHMPAGCGTWPAYWLVGQNWPNNGEIDIVEGVNKQAANGFALHTGTGCTMSGLKQLMTGTSNYPSYDVKAVDQPSNTGCGIKTTLANSYGTTFNENGGDVYAMRWEKETGIKIWFFSRKSIPSDIKSEKPNPEKWGTPAAHYPFGNNCNATSFNSMKIVINLTFCGDWAGTTSAYKGCPSDCKTYVMNTPHAFDEAYWDINSIKVYQK